MDVRAAARRPTTAAAQRAISPLLVKRVELTFDVSAPDVHGHVESGRKGRRRIAISFGAPS